VPVGAAENDGLLLQHDDTVRFSDIEGEEAVSSKATMSLRCDLEEMRPQEEGVPMLTL